MPSCDDTELTLLHDRYDGIIFRDSYKLIKPISTADFVAYFKKILGAQQSLTSYDKEVVTYLIDNYNMTIISKRIKKEGKLKTVWIVSQLN